METLLGVNVLWVVRLLIAAWLAVLFLQSGLDKAFDRPGNLAYLTEHFARSPLRGQVPWMLTVVTATEVAAGLLSALGVVALLVTGAAGFAFLGCAVAALNLLMLFFGQRVAKDYGGAEVLTNYFVLAVIGMLVMRGLPGLE